MKKSEKPWQTPTKKMTNNMNQWCHDWVLSPLDSIVITTLTKTFDVMMSFQNMNFANPPIIKFPHFLSPFSSPIFVSFFCSLCHKCHFRLWCQSTISCPIFFPHFVPLPCQVECHVTGAHGRRSHLGLGPLLDRLPGGRDGAEAQHQPGVQHRDQRRARGGDGEILRRNTWGVSTTS